MTKQLITYVRWSSDEQTKGDSLRRQQNYIQKFKEGHPEYESSPEFDYMDKGVSGFKKLKKKPARMTAEEWEKKRELTMNQLTGDLSRFYTDMRNGKFAKGSTLIVEALDRLSRKPADEAYDDIREITKKYGINIHTIADNEWYTSKTDILQILKIFIKQEVANEESAKKSKRGVGVWEGKNEKVVTDPNNYTLTTLTPGWITVDPDTKKRGVNLEKAEILKQIYLMRDSGMSYIAIAIELNRSGTPTLNERKIRKERLAKIAELREQGDALRAEKKAGRRRKFTPRDENLHDDMAGNWSKETVKFLLKTETVLGVLPATAKRPAVPGYYPQVISQELYDSVQLKSRGKKQGRCSATDDPLYVNLFKGIMLCGHCGLTMNPSGVRPTNHYYGTYRCNGHVERRNKFCNTASRKPFDLNMTSRLFANLKVLMATAEGKPAIAKRNPQIELEDVKKLIVNLTETIVALSAVGVPPEILKQMTEAKAKQNALEIEITNNVVRNQVINGEMDVASLDLDKFSDRNRVKDTIAQIVKQIVVFGNNQTCDVYLYNGSVIRGIEYTKEGSLLVTMYNATDNERIAEINMIAGVTRAEFIGSKPTGDFTPIDYDAEGWPEVEPDYPNTDEP